MKPDHIKYIGEDKPRLEFKPEPEMHWYERVILGYKTNPRRKYKLGDEMSDHSDSQGWDKFEE